MRRNIALALITAGVFGVLAAGGRPVSAGPEIYNVDSLIDSPSADPTDLPCESVAGGCTLRAAVQEANSDDEPQTIVLPPGTFTLSIPGAGENEASTGDLDITEDLTITGAGATAAGAGTTGNGITVIDAGGLDRGFHIHPDVTVTLVNMTITGGVAPAGEPGGGIWNRGTLIVDHVVVTGNTVTDDPMSANDTSGGISNQQGNLTLRHSTISNNSADRGGGVFNAGTSEMSVEASTFSGNTARAGGAIVTFADMELVNVTVSGNSATGNSAGVLVSGTEGGTPFAVTITNSTIASNPGDTIDGLRASSANGTTTVTNTIIAENGFTNCSEGVLSGGHNIDSDGTCGFNAAGDLPNVDAGLAPLGDYGGPTQTHALLAGSPAIDAGDDAACPPEDQRGVARPVDGDGIGGPVCDIGAVETEDPIQGSTATWGDHNCSESADPVDALLGLRFDAGLPAETGDCPEMGEVVDVLNSSPHPWGDVDCSDTIDPVDSLKILRFDAGLPVEQPPGCPEIGDLIILTEP